MKRGRKSKYCFICGELNLNPTEWEGMCEHCWTVITEYKEEVKKEQEVKEND